METWGLLVAARIVSSGTNLLRDPRSVTLSLLLRLDLGRVRRNRQLQTTPRKRKEEKTYELFACAAPYSTTLSRSGYGEAVNNGDSILDAGDEKSECDDDDDDRGVAILPK